MTQEDVLRKVRALLAKANSTEFPAEREAFLAKADALMAAHAIEQWQLAQADPSQAKKPINVDFDMSWYYGEENRDVASSLWTIFSQCLNHTRCVSAPTHVDWKQDSGDTMPVFGSAEDVAYLGMLFTDIFAQMSKTLRPKYDPAKTEAENVYIARNAGMKWQQVALWSGHPEYVTAAGKMCDNGKLKRAYQAWAKANDLEIHGVQSHVYVRSFVMGFASGVRKQMQDMAAGNDDGSGTMALVVRDAQDKARDLMFEMFPDTNPVNKSKEIRRRRVPKGKEVSIDWSTMARGSTEGQKANIIGKNSGSRLADRKHLEG